MHFLRQGFQGMEFRDTNWLAGTTQSILNHRFVLALAQDDADGRLIVEMAHQIVHCRQVELHLPSVPRTELFHLEINDDKAAQLQVVEEEINEELVAHHLKAILAAHKSEADAKFQKELTDVPNQTALHILLMSFFHQRQEVKVVRVFEKVFSKVGLRSRQCLAEIGERLALPMIEPALDLEGQDVARLPIFGCGFGIPQTLLRVLYLVKQHAVVKPRDLCSNLLHNCLIRLSFSKRTHVF